MTIDEKIDARVSHGIAWLDETYGKRWVKKINLQRLNLGDCRDCILGQLESELFHEAITKLNLSLDDTVAFGFELPIEIDPSSAEDYWTRLTAAWKRHLTEPEQELI